MFVCIWIQWFEEKKKKKKAVYILEGCDYSDKRGNYFNEFRQHKFLCLLHNLSRSSKVDKLVCERNKLFLIFGILPLSNNHTVVDYATSFNVNTESLGSLKYEDLFSYTT